MTVSYFDIATVSNGHNLLKAIDKYPKHHVNNEFEFLSDGQWKVIEVF